MAWVFEKQSLEKALDDYIDRIWEEYPNKREYTKEDIKGQFIAFLESPEAKKLRM